MSKGEAQWYLRSTQIYIFYWKFFKKLINIPQMHFRPPNTSQDWPSHHYVKFSWFRGNFRVFYAFFGLLRLKRAPSGTPGVPKYIFLKKISKKSSKLSKNIFWTAQHASKVQKLHLSKKNVIFSHFSSFLTPPKTDELFYFSPFFMIFLISNPHKLKILFKNLKKYYQNPKHTSKVSYDMFGDLWRHLTTNLWKFLQKNVFFP